MAIKRNSQRFFMNRITEELIKESVAGILGEDTPMPIMTDLVIEEILKE